MSNLPSDELIAAVQAASANIDGDRPTDEIHDCIRAALTRDDEKQVHEFDAVFEQLKADVLQGLAEADAGNTVSEEEMRAMFGLTEKP